MIRILLTGNSKLMNSICSKILQRCFRKNLGCKTAKVLCKDICVENLDEERFCVHFNGDIELRKEELLILMDKKLREAE